MTNSYLFIKQNVKDPRFCMKIGSISLDKKTQGGALTVEMTNLDDLYTLSQILEIGDRVESFTTRKISLDGGKTQQKIALKLQVKAETYNYDLEDGIVIVKGKTCCENEHVKLGSYHSLNINLHEKFKIFKNNWKHSQVRELQDATNEAPEICFIIFYDREAVVSSVSSNSIKTIHKEELKNKNYKSLLACVSQQKEKMKIFIIASFSDIRSDFSKKLFAEVKTIEKLTTVIKLSGEYKGISNTKAISKLLTDKSHSKAFTNIKYIDDLRSAEELFTAIRVESVLVAIGKIEILEAFEYGAVSKLFLLNTVYRPRTIDERQNIESLLADAREMRAQICVIPADHELGERLNQLGGFAAFLKFSYK
ncbi:protein pelota [Enteropsectra breve]|nr:protein pelota [Enteropsectra breve]